MSVSKTNNINNTTTFCFYGSAVRSAVTDHTDSTVTFTYRDERSVTHYLDGSIHACAVSYDGQLFFFSPDGNSLRCCDIETFQTKWEFSGTVNALIPAEDGIIVNLWESEISFKHQTDADGREIFDKAKRTYPKLVKLSSDDGRVLYSHELGNIQDITHDHLLARGDDRRFYILRKADLSTVSEYPTDDAARYFSPCCVRDERLIEFSTVRAYGSLYNTQETDIGIVLPDEVLACAEKYADENEEKYKLLCEYCTKYDFADRRLKGIVTADGEIDDYDKFMEFTSLYLVPYCSESAKNCCSLCGEAVSEGYAALDGSKHICGSCFDTFEDILHLKHIGNIPDELAERMNYGERIDKCRNKHPLVPFNSKDFAYLISDRIARITRRTTDSRTETWFHKIDPFFSEYIGQLEKSVLNESGIEEITITIVDANASSEDCMELTIGKNGTKAAAYPSVVNAGAPGAESFRILLPNFKNDDLTENPFGSYCTDFEVVDTYHTEQLKDRLALLDIFAKAVYADGGRVICLTDIDHDSIGRVYFADAGDNGAVMNDLLRRFMCGCPSFAFYAEGFGAVLCSRLGYAVIGGNHEFTRKMRDLLRGIGCMGTFEFVKKYYIYYEPDMSGFYSRKRAIVTWVTRTEEYPDGLYDIIHAHIFCNDNRQFISDGTKCGCFHCVETFDGAEIGQWTDGGRTALCPKCMIDSVIPKGCGYSVDENFLLKMKKCWF